MKSPDSEIAPQAWVSPGYLATHASRVFHRMVDASLKPHGVSVALLGPLLLLSRKGPMLQRDLVKHSAVAQPAMVALLSKLESEGLITRQVDPSDRRAAKVALSKKGQKVADIGKDILISANAVGLSGFSKAETALLTNLLQRLIVNFENVDDK